MNYLKIPVRSTASAKTLRLLKNGELILDLAVRYEGEKPDFNYYYPVYEDGISLSLDGVTDHKIEICSAPSTEEGANEKQLRPKLHFTARSGWLNDPNGLFYYKGLYHMFFQYNPVGPVWGNMHWGHAVSEDLVHWTELDIALFPDKLGTMFSGSAIVDTENASGLKSGGDDPILLFYTAAGATSVLSAGQKSTQCMAYSTDGGITFKKYENNPVIPHIKAENRDPKVIRDGSGGYFCVLYLDGSQYALWHSKDLLNWFLVQTINLPGDSECPDLYPLPFEGGVKWVFSGASDRYYIGEIKNGVYVPDGPEPRHLSYGRASYAAQTWSDVPDGRRLRIAWSRWDKINPAPLRYWSAMSVPCEMGLKRIKNSVYLTCVPASEIANSSVNTNSFTDITLSKSDGIKVFPCKKACLISIVFTGVSPFIMWINGYKVEYDGETLTCGDMSARLPDKLSDLTLIADTTGVEVFACGGSVCFCDAFISGENPALVIKPCKTVKLKELNIREI